MPTDALATAFALTALLVTVLLNVTVIWLQLDDLACSHRWARVLARVLAPLAKVPLGCIIFVIKLAALRPGGALDEDRLADALSLSRFAPRLAAAVVARASTTTLARLPVPAHPIHPRTAQALVSHATRLATPQPHEKRSPLDFPTRAFANVAANAHDPVALAELFTAPQFRENLANLANRHRYQFGEIERAIGSNPHLTAAVLAASPITAPAACSLLKAAAEHDRNLLADHLGVPFSLDAAAELLVPLHGQRFAAVLAGLEHACASSPLASSSPAWASALVCVAGRSGDRSITEAAELLEHLAAAASREAVSLFVDLLRAGAAASFDDLAAAVPELLAAAPGHA